MKTLEDLGWKKEKSNINDYELYERYSSGCSNILSFDKRVKQWAISSKSLYTKKWEVIGITIEDTEVILAYAKEIFKE